MCDIPAHLPCSLGCTTNVIRLRKVGISTHSEINKLDMKTVGVAFSERSASFLHTLHEAIRKESTTLSYPLRKP